MNKVLLTIIFFIAFIAKISAQCAPVPVPFSQSFSTGALPTCWTNQNPTSTSTSANAKWKFSGSAGYGATGNGGKPAGTFAWVDASSPYTGLHNVELISPQINLTGLTNPYVEFEWFKNHLTSATGTVPNYEDNQLKLEVNDGSGWVQVWTGNTNDPAWRTVGVPLATTFINATIQLKFTVDKDIANDGYFYDDILLDEVKVIQAPTCFEPTTSPVTNIAPTSGTINWNPPAAPAPAPANGYEYYYNTTNTAPVAATVGSLTNATTANLTPLVPGTTYYWWVRSVCSPTDKSSWVAGDPFTPGQIGGGTATHSFLPVYSCSGYNYSQQIYTASEVTSAVGTNNYITSIKFYVSSTAATQANYNQWEVYMGNTTQTDFATTTSWVPSSSLNQVYSGTLPAMTAGTWVTIPLSTPFLWDGTSNVVIAVDENSTGTSCTANWGSFTAGANRGMAYRNTTTNPDPANPPTATSRYSVIPTLQLVGTTLQPCTTAPPANITVNNITTTSATVTWTPSANATYVVRYRILPSGAWQTINVSTPNTNNVTIPGLTETTQYEVEVATICGGTQGAFSLPVAFTTPALTYCSSGTATVTNAYISNITIIGTNVPTFSNNSGPSTYTDYSTDPTKTITLLRNTTNNVLSVGRAISSGTYSTYAWIDFDGDGVFNNTPSTTPGGERIMNLGYSNTTPVTANFAVPANAYLGTSKIKMRVIVYFLTPADACANLTSNGEVEDYYVKFVDLQPCTTNPPTNIMATNLTATTAYISWLPATGATYVIRWREGATGAWLPSAAGLTLPVGQSSHTITLLTEQTGYQVQVATICNGTTGAFSPSVSFTTPPVVYCNMTGTGTNDYISDVKVTPVNFPVMDNTSLQTNYTSYTTPATLINLEIGSTGNQLSVSKGWVGTTYSDAVYAYIDYNRDGIFTDSERIMTSAPSTTTPVTATFDVPATGVYTGPFTTTMRVVLKRTSAPVMCQNPANGEVEDYAVRLRPCSNVTPGAPTFTLVTHNSATVNWTPATNNNSYVLQYRPVTNPASAWTSVNASVLNGNPPVQLTGLTPATTYEVQIAAVCGGGPGAFTAIETFTTRCDPTPPNVTVSNVTPNSALVTWNPIVASATYTLRYRKVGTATWTEVPNLIPPVNSYTISGLDSFVTYEVQVASTCVGETTPNPWANPQVFTTVRICEIPPPGLTITQLTPTSAEVIWDSFPGATYILRYRKVGIPSWIDIPVNTNTYTITGLLELTKYEMQVANICNGTPGNYTKLYYFTTPTVVYCQMSSASSANEFISKVTAKPNGKPEMINETQASNYSDFTGDNTKFIEMVQGSSNNQIIIDKTLSSGADAGVAVWIDFNRNGYFDINERILADGPNNNATASATFTVPADAFVSMTDYKYVVMRVAMQKDGIPVNCTNFADGEVEDYTVRISKQGVVNSVNQDDILIYPNPVKTVLNVKNISEKANYKIYSSAGRLISTGLIVNNKIDVSNLINGLYVISIEDVKGNVQKKFIKE